MSKIADFAREELGLTLTSGQLDVLEGFEAGGFSEGVWCCGRRGGKSTLADVIALYDALTRDQLRDFLLPGEPRIAAIVAQNLGRARRHITRCAAWVKRNPNLSRLLVSETADELTFSNGSAIAAFPCSARSLRGDAWSCAILDELAHFTDTTDGNASGQMVYEAISPSLAQFANAGWLISISTPRWRQGMFWSLVQRGQSGRFPRLHYVHKASQQMNDRLSAEYLAEKQLENPDNFRREYLAEFSDAGAFLDSLDVLGCVRRGEGILPPAEGVRYRAAIDSWPDTQVSHVHDTGISPRASLTMSRRSRLTITAPNLPGAGGLDDPNNFNFFAYQGAADPGALNFKLQATQTAQTLVMTGYNASGAADVANSYPAGTAAEIASQTGGLLLKGDGTARFNNNMPRYDNNALANAGLGITTTTAPGEHLGLGSSIQVTPAVTGRVMVTIKWDIADSSSATTTFTNVRAGTGAAPALGAAATGTQPDNSPNHTYSGFTSGTYTYQGIMVVNFTGLAIGTTYWFDLIGYNNGGTSTYSRVSAHVEEY